MPDAIYKSPPLGVPELNHARTDMLWIALRKGWQDFKTAPLFGLFFASIYILCGLIMLYVTRMTGQVYWLVFAAIGFPLIGPFAAVGLYEVSRRLEEGRPLDWRGILGVVAYQRNRQLPSICAIVIMVFLFWFFIAHMIFALFLGLSTMTNISTSYEVYLTGNGLMMLAVGSAVGAALSALLFAITVISLPLLLDREVDFVTAMITSFKVVQDSPGTLFLWAVVIAAVTLLSLLPLFMGLFLTLPLFGHATWHLYRQITADEASSS